jgi:uncharacterized membrane protein HdeD (DUF308 family)
MMEKETLSNLKDAIKHWYLSLILGIVFIAVGIWVLRTPLESYVALAVLFSFTFLFAGILEIAFALGNRNRLSNWGWSLAGGIVDLLIGTLLVSHPTISIFVLPFYVGFAVLFRSIMTIGWSIELKNRNLPDWGYLMAIGVLGLLFSFVLLWNPLFAGMTIVFYTAWAFIAIGAFNIYLSLRLRALSK